jgi:RND superfamily putative drug exporter
MINRLIRLAVRFPVVVLVIWAATVGTLSVIGVPTIQNRLLPATLFIPGTDSNNWEVAKQPNYGDAMALAIEGPAATIDAVGPKLNAALNLRPLTRSTSPWSPGAGPAGKFLRPSPTEAVFALDVRYQPGQNATSVVPPLENFIKAHVPHNVKTFLSGDDPLGAQLNNSGFEALHQGEVIAAPLLIIILLLVFRSPIAAAIPLLIAGGTVGAGFGVMWIVTHFMDLALMSLSLASMLGLALGVDYALLLVSRFREALDEGMQPKQAATLAANTAGRTAIFAAFVLSALMITVIVLSPGSILQSGAIGAIIVVLIAMTSAVMVCPAMLTLLGHNVNKWQIGGRGEERNLIGKIVGFSRGRPALAAALMMLVLLVLASPVLALKTTPADPKELPAGNPALTAYDEIRKAGLGPNVDIIMRAKDGGALTTNQRLQAISKFEDMLGKVPYVKFIAGPGVLAAQSRLIAQAPKQIAAAKRQIASAETQLGQKSAQISAAKTLLANEKVKLSQGLGSAQALLNQGRSMLANIGGQFTSQFGQLVTGLGVAASGAGALGSGTRTLQSNSQTLANVLATIRDKVAALQPVIQQADKQVREAGAALSLLRVPVQVTVREIQNTLAALNSATVGQADPQVQAAKLHATAALAAATGTSPVGSVPDYPGLDASLQQAAAAAEVAGNQVDSAVRQAGYAYDVMVQIADGAGRLASPGLSTIVAGLRQLASGLQLAHDKVAAAEPQIQALTSNANAMLANGQSQLNQAGAQAFPQLQYAQGQLNAAGNQIDTIRGQLISKTGPFRPLREIDQIETQSPFLFQSPYVLVAALQGAPPVTRVTAETVVDSSTGGNVARIIMLPNVPTNDPRQDLVVKNVRSLTKQFTQQTGLKAAVGGSAAELLDFRNVMGSRVPIIIFALCLITYLMLVPILRSVVLPAIAVGLNVLTVVVAMAVVTCFTVDGVISTPSPLGGAGKPDLIAVVSVFCIIFALSIDYYVFLLTRMREEYVRTQSNEGAVVFGIERTGRIVTGAAAIMIGTFFAFAIAKFVLVAELGIGLTSAILVDATLVRLGLLPAIMRTFGDWTWYIPKWLDDKLPTFDIEGSEFEHEAQIGHGLPVGT